MVEHDYFAHQREGGPDLTERLDRVGWNGEAWGENIAYGCGSSSSPKATLRNWLNSPPHRDLLLSGTYRRGGLGVGSEAPCGDGGAIWVLDVGQEVGEGANFNCGIEGGGIERPRGSIVDFVPVEGTNSTIGRPAAETLSLPTQPKFVPQLRRASHENPRTASTIPTAAHSPSATSAVMWSASPSP